MQLAIRICVALSLGFCFPACGDLGFGTIVDWGGGNGTESQLLKASGIQVQADALSLRRAMAEEHRACGDNAINTSKTDYLWVAGVYPIWSGGADGLSQCLVEQLRPMLIRHGAQFISGHTHLLEHISHDGLETFVVGACKERCYPPINMLETPTGSLKYMLAGDDGQENETRPTTTTPIAVRGGLAALKFGAFARVTFHADLGSQWFELYVDSRRIAALEFVQTDTGFPQTWWVALFLIVLYFSFTWAFMLFVCTKWVLAKEPSRLLHVLWLCN